MQGCEKIILRYCYLKRCPPQDSPARSFNRLFRYLLPTQGRARTTKERGTKQRDTQLGEQIQPRLNLIPSPAERDQLINKIKALATGLREASFEATVFLVSKSPQRLQTRVSIQFNAFTNIFASQEDGCNTLPPSLPREVPSLG